MSRPVRRVFLGLTEVSGHYGNLAAGFRALGIPTTYLNLTGHRYNYGGDDPYLVARWCRQLTAARQHTHGWRKLMATLLLAILRVYLLAWVIACCDVVVLGFGTSFFALYDLPILKFFRKTLLFQFHGSDSRPPYMDGSVVPEGGAWTPTILAEQTAQRKRVVARIDRWADAVIDNPTSGHFHERPVYHWLRVGLPTAPTTADNDRPPASMPPVALHCPSHRAVKGTNQILAAVARVQQRVPLQLQLLEGVPNQVVRAALAECALVIDQLYSDYAMPGFATEAAWHNRAVLIAGYAADQWPRWLPEDMRPPTYFVLPDELEPALQRLASDPHLRQEVGERARRFVTEQWAPALVAERMLRIVHGTAPHEWLFDPMQTDYVYGCGASAAWLAQVGRQLVAACGRESLQVCDKPALEERLIRFYHQGEHS